MALFLKNLSNIINHIFLFHTHKYHKRFSEIGLKSDLISQTFVVNFFIHKFLLCKHLDMDPQSKEIATEILPYIRVYKDGSVERLSGSPNVPPSAQDPLTGVSSKDIIISKTPQISARIYLPKQLQVQQEHQKVPVLVYFHGGVFCFESAFSFLETRYMNRLAHVANIVVISIDYRLAPEYPLPICYEDCWTGLQWVVSHSSSGSNNEPWLSTYVDFDRVYVGGDSAGANIAHNIVMRAGSQALNDGVKIKGAFITHPYFWGSKPIGSEIKNIEEREKLAFYTIWKLLYPDADGGIDNPMVNPVIDGAPSLAGLGCSRLLVCVAGIDVLRDRGVMYYNAVKESGWEGELMELVDTEGEDHVFHVHVIESDKARKHIKHIASFIV